MGKIPKELRDTIARNIRDCREKLYPGRGGQKKCAEAFTLHVGRNVSPQQWSPWERGMRTPDEVRLDQLAKFFHVTVEYLRKDHRPPIRPPGAPPFPKPDEPRELPPDVDAAFGLPNPHPYAPGSPESFYWLAVRLVDAVVGEGIRIRLDPSTAELIASALSRKSVDS